MFPLQKFSLRRKGPGPKPATGGRGQRAEIGPGECLEFYPIPDQKIHPAEFCPDFGTNSAGNCTFRPKYLTTLSFREAQRRGIWVSADGASKLSKVKPAVSHRHRISMPVLYQVGWLFILAIPIACVAWTVTHEEILREPREYCQQQSKQAQKNYQRKFFYLFTCEYCFSHYVTIFILFITRFKLLYEDWRGYLLALFALVWVANQYMSIYNRLRLDIKHQRIEIKAVEQEVEEKKAA